MGRAARLGEIVDHELLFEAASCEDLRAWLRGKCNGTDYVGMLEGMQAFASMSIPDFAVQENYQLP